MNKIGFTFVYLIQLTIITLVWGAPRPECGKNEMYMDCGPKCPETCEWLNKNCTLQSKKCSSGCYCKDGYVRMNEKCYKAVKVCCQENEIYNDQNPACESNCDNYHENCVSLSKNMVKGCYCKDKYARNKYGKCVPHYQCSIKCDRDHEVYDSCPTTCTKTCVNPNGIDCDLTSCSPQCMCKDGYVRKENHDCILQKHCPVKCGANEAYSKCGADVICNKNMTSKQCETGCFCSNGYVRAIENGECISKLSCDAQKSCGKHEEYMICGPNCPQTCNWFDKPCTITVPKPCIPGCYCKNGYVRENKKCVRGKKICCTANEIYSLAFPSCEKTCYNHNGTCTKKTQKYGCYCAQGYVRDEATGNCIAESDCTPLTCSGKHEVYLDCQQGCPQTCEWFYRQCKINSSACEPGCYCEEGYVRLNGKCVRGNKVCCPENEILVSSPSCDKTCDEPYKNCFVEKHERRRCYCQNGYVRGADGVCIRPLHCPIDYSPQQHCSENEHYSNCEIDDLCNKTDNAKSCWAGCFCNDGYSRQSKTGKCIIKSLCNSHSICPPNEEYLACGTACPKTCVENLHNTLCIEQCVKGCFCRDELLRNKHGVCVKKKYC